MWVYINFLNQLLAYFPNTDLECVVLKKSAKSFHQKPGGNQNINVKHVISYKHGLYDIVVWLTV